MKKAVIDSTVLTYIISIIVIALLVILLVKGRDIFQTNASQGKTLVVEEQIKALSENIHYGNIKEASFDIPSSTRICFLDSRREKLDIIYSRNFPIVKQYSVIEDSINPSNPTDKNVFYIDKNKNKVVKSAWLPDICYSDEPYYECVDAKANKVNLWLEGKGRCTSIMIEWKYMAINNKKNLSKYLDGQLFITWDNDETHTNWANILSMMPLTVSTTLQGTLRFPYVVIHSHSLHGGFSVDNMTQIMDKFNTNVSFILGQSPINPNYGNLGGNYSLYDITPQIYFDFWEKYDQVVISPSSNESVSMRAALFAASINAPMIFIDSGNAASYQSYITGRDAYLFDTHTLISQSIYDSIKTSAKKVINVKESPSGTEDEVTYTDLPSTSAYSKMSVLN